MKYIKRFLVWIDQKNRNTSAKTLEKMYRFIVISGSVVIVAGIVCLTLIFSGVIH